MSLEKLKESIRLRDSRKVEPKKPENKSLRLRVLPRHEILAWLNWNRPLLRVGTQLLNTRSAEVIKHLNAVPSEGEGNPNGKSEYIV